MELNAYLRLIQRWLWVIVLAAIVLAASGYLIRTRQNPVYRASTKLLVGGFLQTPNPQASDIATSIELVKTYTELLKTNAVLQATVDAYDLPVSAIELGENTQIVVTDQTSILEILVTYDDPETAAQMANGLAEQLILRSPTHIITEQQTQISDLEAQIATLKTLLAENRVRLAEITTQLQELLPFEEVSQLDNERSLLTEQNIQITDTIEQLSDNLSDLRQQSNALAIIDPALVPDTPVGVNKWIVTALAGIVGALAATGAVVAWDELNRPLKTATSAAKQLEVPVLGAIPRFSSPKQRSPLGLIACQDPQAPASEAYRMLQASLLFEPNQQHSPYIITSPNPGEGKSLTAANLATTMALSGLQVLLIDANLLNPQLHKIFGVDNAYGLVNLLADSEPDLLPSLQKTELANLFLLPRGTLNNPAAVPNLAFRLHQFPAWIDALQAKGGMDVIIFDTPASLTSSESLILATALQSAIILVIEIGKTRSADAQTALQKFTQIGQGIKGIALNKS